MPYSEALENRLNQLLLERGSAIHENMELKKMFGGLAYMYCGKMSIGIVGEALMVRIPGPLMEQALLLPGARPMEFTGRPMKEFVFVDPEGYRDIAAINQWIDWGLEHARSKAEALKSKASR